MLQVEIFTIKGELVVRGGGWCHTLSRGIGFTVFPCQACCIGPYLPVYVKIPGVPVPLDMKPLVSLKGAVRLPKTK